MVTDSTRVVVSFLCHFVNRNSGLQSLGESLWLKVIGRIMSPVTTGRVKADRKVRLDLSGLIRENVGHETYGPS